MPSPAEQVARAVVALLEKGVEQGQEALHYLRATHGGDSPEDVAQALAIPDDPDSRSLVALLLFPGQEQLAALEPELRAAACTPEEAALAARMAEAEVEAAFAVLPGGKRIPLPLEPGDVAALLLRLKPDHSPPPQLANTLLERLPAAQANRCLVLLRHCRLDWSPERVLFLTALAAGLPPDDPDMEDVLAWTLAWLSTLPPRLSPADRLGPARAELAGRLRRSVDFHEALAKSSYEVMMAQGGRASLPHPEQVRREIALLDAACLAATGRPGWALMGLSEIDLGTVEDEEALLKALERF